MQNKKGLPCLINIRGFAHIFLLIALVFVLTLGFVFYKLLPFNPFKALWYKINPSACVQNTGSIYKCPNTTTNETNEIDISNWKTYKNGAFLFSFRYPNDWGIKETSVKLDEGTETQIVLSIINSDKVGDAILFNVLDNDTWNNFVKSGADNYQPNGRFNGIPAMLSIRGELDARSNDSIIIKSPITGQYISIIFDYKLTNNKKLIDQILSTFQFINNETQSKTPGWNTYTNQRYQFTIDYPNNYTLEDKLPDSHEDWRPQKVLSISNPKAEESPKLIIEANYDGYGPIFFTGKIRLRLENLGLTIIGVEPSNQDEYDEMVQKGFIVDGYQHYKSDSINHQNDYFDFQISYTDGSHEKAENELIRILSTFKFLE